MPARKLPATPTEEDVLWRMLNSPPQRHPPPKPKKLTKSQSGSDLLHRIGPLGP